MADAAITLLRQRVDVLRKEAVYHEGMARETREAARRSDERAVEVRREAEQIWQALERLQAVERGTVLG